MLSIIIPLISFGSNIGLLIYYIIIGAMKTSSSTLINGYFGFSNAILFLFGIISMYFTFKSRDLEYNKIGTYMFGLTVVNLAALHLINAILLLTLYNNIYILVTSFVVIGPYILGVFAIVFMIVYISLAKICHR